MWDEEEAEQKESQPVGWVGFPGRGEGPLSAVGDEMWAGAGGGVGGRCAMTLSCWEAIYGMTPTRESWVLT